MTSSNGNIFRITGPLCVELTGIRWFPLTKASDAELWCFPWSRRLWFETPSRLLWRHCNVHNAHGTSLQWRSMQKVLSVLQWLRLYTCGWTKSLITAIYKSDELFGCDQKSPDYCIQWLYHLTWPEQYVFTGLTFVEECYLSIVRTQMNRRLILDNTCYAEQYEVHKRISQLPTWYLNKICGTFWRNKVSF